MAKNIDPDGLSALFMERELQGLAGFSNEGEDDGGDYEYFDCSDDDYDLNDPVLRLEEAIGECGQGHDYDGCVLAGSEYCDFDCPFRDEMYRKARSLKLLRVEAA
jgi:hypothetical protein